LLFHEWYRSLNCTIAGRQEREFISAWGTARDRPEGDIDTTLFFCLVVFIGQELDKDLITKTLNEVLLTDSEWAQWEKVSRASDP
jgi:hypothetical protein